MMAGRNSRGGLIGLDADHLRAWHHDVAYLQVGDLDGTFDDGQRLAVEQLVLMGFAQDFQQLLAILGLMGKSLGDFFPARSSAR